MPYQFSQVATNALAQSAQLIADMRNKPVRGRVTSFRLMQQNILSYTFGQWIPGFSGSHVYNTTPFDALVAQGVHNADDEGALRFTNDYRVAPNARAKVLGDIYEVLTTAVLWNAAAYWNEYMATGQWNGSPRYPRPRIPPSPTRQVAVLNLPRGYDWVDLLNDQARQKIKDLRAPLEAADLSIPTSTPDIAVVVLPDASTQADVHWRTPLPGLLPPGQLKLSGAHARLGGQIEPGELILAIAVKRSLRSDRLYQPLYEANVMQLLLERFLNAPRVDFEVHTLEREGTAAVHTYSAATLYAVAMQLPTVHRAVRELYVPKHAEEMARRFLIFLSERMKDVP
jgi:Cfr10I/Bse634I restriction endonuclease